MEMMISSFFVVKLTQILLSVGLIISSSELISIRNEFKKGGILNLSLSKSYHLKGGNAINDFFANYFTKYNIVLFLIAGRLFLGVLLLFTTSSHLISLTILIFVITFSLLINFSMAFGKDGSDQMLFIVTSGLLVAHFGFLNDNDWLTNIAFWFIALQSILSYFTAGIAKLAGKTWIKGLALREVISTQTYGNSFARKLLANDKIAILSNWAVITFEVLFPLILFASIPFTYIFLGIALFFHVCIAYVMGLNTFIWAFGATYPAIAYCSNLIN